MKKSYFKIVLMAIIAAVMITGCKTTSTTEKLEKEKSGMYKSKMKEYKNDGWKLAGSSKTLEVALLEHYVKLDKAGARELAGEVQQCKSINVCKQVAYNNAVTYYANLAGSFVKGRIASDLNADQSDKSRLDAEFDKMYAAYERLVAQEIRGELTESYAIIKEGELANQYKVFFVVSEDEASKARIRALERAAKETEVAQEYARKITDFVREGFPITQ
jgi:hypothetical protein